MAIGGLDRILSFLSKTRTSPEMVGALVGKEITAYSNGLFLLGIGV